MRQRVINVATMSITAVNTATAIAALRLLPESHGEPFDDVVVSVL